MIDGLAGAKVPAITWYGALLSLMGIAMLERCGSSVCVSVAPCLSSALYCIMQTFFSLYYKDKGIFFISILYMSTHRILSASCICI